jgi:hypothetical protein
MKADILILPSSSKNIFLFYCKLSTFQETMTVILVLLYLEATANYVASTDTSLKSEDQSKVDKELGNIT